MIPKTIEFEVEKRKNSHTNSGYEFAVNCKINEGEWCTITAYHECPTDKKMAEIKHLVMRAMSLYHRHITFPLFDLEEKYGH